MIAQDPHEPSHLRGQCAEERLPVSCSSGPQAPSARKPNHVQQNRCLCSERDRLNIPHSFILLTHLWKKKLCVLNNSCRWFLLRLPLKMTDGVSSSTCAGLNETELSAGRASSSCDGVRSCRKGTPSAGRRGANSARRPGLSEEGIFNSVLFSSKLENWTKSSQQAQRQHKYIVNAPSMWKHTVKKPHVSAPTRLLGRLSPSRVQFMTMSLMTLNASVSLYTSRSSGSARHEIAPSLQLKTLM